MPPMPLASEYYIAPLGLEGAKVPLCKVAV